MLVSWLIPVVFKTPLRCRSFIAAVLIAGTSLPAQAETLTEAEVIRLAKARDPEVQAARESVSVAEAEGVQPALYPNPSFAWQREYAPGPAGERADSLFLTVPVEVSGRRPTQKALSRYSALRKRAEAAQTESEAVLRTLEAFYTALAAERSLQIETQRLTKLENLARVVRRRHEEGTTSGYERTKLELEAELARVEVSEAQTDARIARATLAALLGLDADTVTLRGDFTTTKPMPADNGRQRTSLRFFSAATSEIRKARSSAGYAWVPKLSLYGGLRISDTTETRYGYVAGLSLALPVFSRGQGLIAESNARGQFANAELRAATRETLLERIQAREQLTAATKQLSQFTSATEARVELLERAAETGYREGERSVADLVDAHGARAEVERRRLSLELRAKRAELKLRAAQGEFE